MAEGKNEKIARFVVDGLDVAFGFVSKLTTDEDGNDILSQPTDDPTIKLLKHLNCYFASWPDGDTGYNLLHMGAALGKQNILLGALSKGVDINVRQKQDGETALYLACHEGHLDTAKILIEKGANKKMKTNDGQTILHAACISGNLSLIRYVLELGIRVNSKTNDGTTALYVIALKGKPEAIELLLEAGAEPGMADQYGYTPLHAAAQEGNDKCVSLLVEMSDKDAKAPLNDCTPLILACKNGHENSAKILLKAGADHSIRNKNKRDALEEAADSGFTKCVTLLLYFGAQVRWDHKKSALQIAREKEHTEIVEALRKVLVDIVRFQKPDGDSEEFTQVAKKLLEDLRDSKPAADPVGGPTPPLPQPPRTIVPLPIYIAPEHVRFDIMPPTRTPRNMRAKDNLFRQLKGQLRSHQMYNTIKAKKGKALIISIHESKVAWLRDLTGYQADTNNLTQLWNNLGFDVFLPSVRTNRCLTTNEMKTAVEIFAGKLTDDDQMAVLCILAHGKDRFVYGTDGKSQSTMDLLHCLDNMNCPKMKHKPKLAIVQSCQGGAADVGVNPYVPAAAPSPIPTISDFVICYPTMPGYYSYVHQTDGSIYVQQFVDIMQKYAASADMMELLTKVNRAVKDKCVQGAVQMSNYQSCLDRALYFLPCVTDFQL